MLKLMIVEDEDIVREGMLRIINFEKLGYEVVAVCKNGKEACESYKSTMPDVVITDICMDDMDGFEFIDSVYVAKSKTKFIVISGYDKFEYLKQAIKFKVFDYVLKPVTASEINEILTKTRLAIELEYIDDLGDHVYHFRKNISIKDEQTVNLLLSEGGYKQIPQQVDLLIESNLAGAKYFSTTSFVIIDIDKVMESKLFESEHKLMCVQFNTIDQIALAYNQKNKISCIIPFCNDSNKIGCLNLSISNGQSEENSFIQFATECIEKFEHIFQISMNARIAAFTEKKEDLHKFYQELQDSDQVVSKNKVVMYKQIIEAQKDASYVPYYQSIFTYTISKDKKSFMESITALFNRLGENYVHIPELPMHLSHMTSYINDLIEENNIKCSPLVCDTSKCKSFFEYMEEVLKTLTKMYAEIVKSTSINKELMIAIADQYIKSNFKDHTLCINSVANAVSVSVSHFSFLFKQLKGTTFVKFLNEVRIDYAKKILKSSTSSISAISEECGYMDVRYFCMVFKNIVGMTAKTYRNNEEV